MKQFTLLLLSLLLIFSCKKEDPEPVCFSQDTIIDGVGTCDGFAAPAWACEVKSVGVFTLDDNSKSFLPLFCETNKNTIVYRNDNGDMKSFRVDQRTYLRSVVAYDGRVACPNDNTKTTAYCIDFEEANFRMTSTDDITITTSVYTRPDLENQTGSNAGDFIQIARTVNNNFLVDFLVVGAQKTLSFETTADQEFYDSIELLGTTFTNVMSTDISSSPSGTFKFYYSKAQGIVGFEDSRGTLWVLEE